MSSKTKKTNNTFQCFVCLMGSSDPDFCSNCGAKIEPIDLQKSIFKPPSWGKYVVSLRQFPKDRVLAAEQFVTKEYFGKFNSEYSESEAVIKSNDLDYEAFIEALAKSESSTPDILKETVIFEPDQASP